MADETTNSAALPHGVSLCHTALEKVSLSVAVCVSGTSVVLTHEITVGRTVKRPDR